MPAVPADGRVERQRLLEGGVAGRTLADLQKGYRSVVDVSDHLWDAAAKGWRETTDRQFQADMQRAELERQAARQAAQPLVEGARRAGQVVSALFRDRPGSTKPEVGLVDQRKIDERVRKTQADIQQNLEAARASGDPDTMAGAWPAAAGAWVSRVWPSGEWDDYGRAKAQHLLDPTGPDPALLERQGNYSYGATAAALGLPKGVALWGAGAMQRLRNAERAVNGQGLRPSVGMFRFPYGDDARDQGPASEGYDNAARRLGPRSAR
jgi:hypothetical protein